MIFTDVQIALDKTLDELQLQVSHAWPNVPFDPEAGTAWLRPTLVSSPSSLLDLERRQINTGIYQIDVFYPADQGPKGLLDSLSSIYDHFKDKDSVSHNSRVVFIRQASVSPFTRDGIWYTGSVTINITYYSN